MYLTEDERSAMRKAWEAELLQQRASGMGWGELAKKHGVRNKQNLRKLVLKLQADAQRE